MPERPIRRFTEEGVRHAEYLLDQIDSGTNDDVESLLRDPKLTEEQAAVVDIRPLADRADAASHLSRALSPLDGHLDLEYDVGLWTWLALAWLDILAPPVLGTRKIGDHVRWVLASDNWRRYYRHLLAGPFYVHRAHGDDPSRAMAVLATPVDRPGDVVEQLTSRQDMVRSREIMTAATKLYFDRDTGKLKRGAASKENGSARRLADILLQLDLNWDIMEMPADDLIALLPPEFDRFR